MFECESALTKKDKEAMIATAKAMYEEGDYRGVINYVDGIFGWAPGELERAYTKEKAEWCIRQL